MKIMRLDMSVLEVGDGICFKSYAYTNTSGGTSLCKHKGNGLITEAWEDDEIGYRFKVKLAGGQIVFVGEFEITG